MRRNRKIKKSNKRKMSLLLTKRLRLNRTKRTRMKILKKIPKQTIPPPLNSNKKIRKKLQRLLPLTTQRKAKSNNSIKNNSKKIAKRVEPLKLKKIEYQLIDNNHTELIYIL